MLGYALFSLSAKNHLPATPTTSLTQPPTLAVEPYTSYLYKHRASPLNMSHNTSDKSSTMVSETKHRISVGSKGAELVGVLTEPPSAIDNPNFKTVYPPKVVLILHGQGGHKDYCYQRMLGQELPGENGMWTFRLDFRGCGESTEDDHHKLKDVDWPEYKVTKPIRTIKRDAEDIEEAVTWLQKRGLTVCALVAHSRGCLAAMEWFHNGIEANKFIGSGGSTVLPAFVNCSGRFKTHEIWDKLREGYGYTWKEHKEYRSVENFGGKYTKMMVSIEEPTSIANTDIPGHCKAFKNAGGHTLTVFGSRDQVVNVEDAGHFANALQPRHHLSIIRDADHNFYGDELPAEKGAEPGKRPKKVNYNPRVTKIIIDWLKSEAFHARALNDMANIGTVTRFKDVDGIDNFRDYGGFQLDSKTTIIQGVLYRCADLRSVTPAGVATINQLGVKAVFDFRSEIEVTRNGFGKVDGTERVHTPVFRNKDLSPEALAERYRNFLDPIEGFKRAYDEILTVGGPSYEKPLRFLLENPGTPMIVHCTAGKDRTGVFCALVLRLLGLDHDTISREYELTTFGLREAVPRLIEALSTERAEWSDPAMAEKMANMLSSRYDCMMQALDLLENKFGGPEKWIMDNCGFSKAEIETLKKNLVAPVEVGWQLSYKM